MFSARFLLFYEKSRPCFRFDKLVSYYFSNKEISSYSFYVTRQFQFWKNLFFANMSSIFLLFEKNISLSIFLILDQISLLLSQKEARVLIKLVLTKKECMLIFFQPHRSKHSIAANRITTTMIHGRLMSSANSDVWNTVNRVFFFAIVLIWKFAVLENVC